MSSESAEPTPSATITVEVNGDPKALSAGARVADLLAELGLGGKRVAVAVNRDVVVRGQHSLHRLAHGDRVEILEAVGGG